jgi:hypothetical protein
VGGGCSATLIYCLEGVDNKNAALDRITVPPHPLAARAVRRPVGRVTTWKPPAA